jgi:peptide/nickel transport system substrate-binding protein
VEVTHPYLAEALPQLNTGSWRVLPDGTMETTYTLRPNLTWHDGRPLTADDFVFAWRVYATPELGASRSRPINLISGVRAPDPRTVVVEWRQPYPDAANLDLAFQALPEHILAEPFQQLDPDGFVNLPFWTREYVGLGAYRLTKWEPGAEIQAVAFENHALGPPKIGQIRILFTPDPNSALATILSGEAHVVSDFILGTEEATTLEREWAARGVSGTVNYAPAVLDYTTIQFRPEHVNPRALQDVRVRRGIAHLMEREAAMEVSTGGRSLITYSLTSPRSPRYPAVEPYVVKRPYDARQAQQAFEEAGMVRGSDGFYLAPGGEPFRLEVAALSGSQRENEIFVDGYRRSGVDAFTYVIPLAQAADNQFRALRPGLARSGLGARALSGFVSSGVPRPENRWGGNIRGGWTNPEYDRLWGLYDTTLDPAQRTRYVGEMERLIADEVAGIPSFFTVTVNAHTPAIRGVVIRSTPDGGFGLQRVDRWEWTG